MGHRLGLALSLCVLLIALVAGGAVRAATSVAEAVGYPEFSGGVDVIAEFNALLGLPLLEPIGYEWGGPMERLLYSIAMVAIRQMGVEGTTQTAMEPSTGEERVIARGGAFGSKVAQILEVPYQKWGYEYLTLWIEHIEATPEMHRFEFSIDSKDFVLILTKTLGLPQEGLEWGILGLSTEDWDLSCLATETMKAWELVITEASVAFYTVRIYDSMTGDALGWDRWDFVEGRSDPVGQEGRTLQCP